MYQLPPGISISPKRSIVLDYEGKCINVYENKTLLAGFKPFWEKVASITDEKDMDQWFDLSALNENDFCSVLYFWQDLRDDAKASNDQEQCRITKEWFPNKEVTITEIGPVATKLWVGKEIEFNEQGQAILPEDLKPDGKKPKRRSRRSQLK